jgi:hypothetical protein
MSEGVFPVPGEPPPTTAVAGSPKIMWSVIALWVVFLVGLGLVSTNLADRTAIAYTAATVLLFMLPGLLVTPIFFGKGPGARIESAIVGAIFGLGISGYVAIVVGFRYGWSPKAITLAILALSALCAVAARIFKSRVSLPVRRWTAPEHCILAAMCTVVVAFSALPALHVGKLTPRGYAYTWLYGLDFVARADYATAMAAKLPPDLFWMAGTPLRMYLVGYTTPAFAFAASGKTVSMHAVMLLTTLCLSIFLVMNLFVLLRTLFSDARVLAGAAFVALIGYSYYWVYAVVKATFVQPGHRFDFHDGVSHLLQRSFLVEPQALLATSLLLVVLSLLALARYRLTGLPMAIFVGVCLGLAFGTEGVQGMVMVGWFGLFYLGRFLFVRTSLREELRPFIAAVASCGVICSSYFLLGMYQRSTSHLMWIGFDPWILKYGLAYLPLEFGPLLILGIWGMLSWWRGAREDFGWPLLLLGFTALMAALLIRTPAPTPARMVDRLWPVALTGFSAYLMRELWLRRGARKAALAAAAFVLAAVPTFFTDIYYTSNIGDLYDTHYVLPEDMEACNWIRYNLPETAVIQGAYNYTVPPDRGLYSSLISSFAQRPQVLGDYSGAAMLIADGWPLATQRRDDIESAMSSGNLESLLRFVQRYSVAYIYAGPLEQRKFKRLLPLLQNTTAEFQQVYSKDGVFIFRVLAGPPQNRAASSPRS